MAFVILPKRHLHRRDLWPGHYEIRKQSRQDGEKRFSRLVLKKNNNK